MESNQNKSDSLWKNNSFLSQISRRLEDPRSVIFIFKFTFCLKEMAPIPTLIMALSYVCTVNAQSVRDPIPSSNEDFNTLRLQKLREAMSKEKVSAYIIPINDDHQTESMSAANRRLAYISGFTGSNGIALVTKNEAILWTDSRYYIQAEKQIGSNWTLVKASEKEYPTIDSWIVKTLNPGEKAASDPKKTSYTEWLTRQKSLYENNITFVPLEKNLIDKIWDSKPPEPSDQIYIYKENFAGESWVSKIKRLRQTLTSLSSDMMVITCLDEIAWLFNLRGSDAKYMPVFYSYSIITKEDAFLYVNKQKVSQEIEHYFSKGEIPVVIKEYEMFWSDLEELEKYLEKILLPSSQNFSRGASYKIYSMVTKEKILEHVSPIINMKAYKNPIEVNGMKKAHIRDAVALCQLMCLLEAQIPQKFYWDELKVSQTLDSLRSQQEFSMGPSFPSIVAFGKNGALPHYVPTKETNIKIDDTGPLTIDSGGQYLDGTIDTTRVLHFGNPSLLEKEIYTLLLKGVADLATSVFPAGTMLQDLDFIIRRPLYQHGFSYGHGSTHGTGVFLGVHEAFNYTYDANFIGSQEPGYYRDNSFGMRLENLVLVIPSNIENHTKKRLLTFEPLTLVPYELKLIDTTILDRSQIKWLNDYHLKVREQVGAEILKQGQKSLFIWLIEKTKPLPIN